MAGSERPGLGLVPRQHGSGEVSHNLGIARNGNRSLRALMIHGARTVRGALARQRDDAPGRWLRRLCLASIRTESTGPVRHRLR